MAETVAMGAVAVPVSGMLRGWELALAGVMTRLADCAPAAMGWKVTINVHWALAGTALVQVPPATANGLAMAVVKGWAAAV